MKTLSLDFGYFALDDPDFLPSNTQVGQWRLAQVELVNWGTFSGYQVLPVDRRNLLITGPSGSGKSTLLDAITTVLTPPRYRHLNAAARGSNTKGEDRTIPSYIRGAWKHEADDSGEISNTYLRPQAATWSGILLRYENGLQEVGGSKPTLSGDLPRELTEPTATTVSTTATAATTATMSTAETSPNKADKPQRRQANEPINLLALFHLKAGSNSRDGLTELYAVIRGEPSLKDFEPYVMNGIDIGKLKRDQQEVTHAYREHSPFAHAFCRLMGIKGPKTLELLHKTQAAKNFGSLDDLFRKFMLDEPQTFQQAEEAVDQFSALSQAHNGVVDQRKQMQHLEPLVQFEANYQKTQAELEQSKRLEDSLGSQTIALSMQYLLTQKATMEREADRATQEVMRLKSEHDQAEIALAHAQASLNEAGGSVLDQANLAVLQYRQRLEYVEQGRKQLTGDLNRAGITELPDSYEEYKELGRSVQDQAEKAKAAELANKDANYARFGQVDQLKKEGEAINQELHHLRSKPTNIPLKLHLIRVAIAEHLGILTEELPFSGELISVKPEHLEWQGAIERLLGQQAKTLLVANRHAKAVATYIEDTDLGLRFEYDVVPPEVEVPERSMPANSLVRMLTVKQHKANPEFTDWLNASLRNRFNYICVSKPAELSEHSHAITIGGQIKKKSRHVKDDRYRLNDRTRWVLGDNNDDKIEQLIQKSVENQEAYNKASAVATKITEQARKVQDLTRLASTLRDSEWDNFDTMKVAEDLRKAEAHLDQLSHSDDRIDQAKRLRDEAEERKGIADEALQGARVNEKQAIGSLNKTLEDIEDYAARQQAASVVSDQDQQQLTKLFKKQNAAYDQSLVSISETSRLVQAAINMMGRKAGDSLQKIQVDAERNMHDYKQLWPIRASDLSEEYAEIQSYLRIYNQIKANGLPDYEQKFLQVLHDFSQDQITIIASTIRRAFREVRDKLEPVNRSLRLSNYSPGTHLQIEVKNNRNKQVNDFLDELQVITEGTWSDDDLKSAEKRYLRIAQIINRFKSPESADKTWRLACLDTRQHVTFTAKELDNEDAVQQVYGSDSGLSGGQKQKLVVFCLAAALRYQLADEDQPIPSYGTVVLDEAFDKADHSFTTTAMHIFRVFGFHMVLATPLKLLQTLEPFIGEIASVHCQDSKSSTLQIVTIEQDVADGEIAGAGGEGVGGEVAGGEAAGSGVTGGEAVGDEVAGSDVAMSDPASEMKPESEASRSQGRTR